MDFDPQIKAMHDAACAAGAPGYFDPETEAFVLTADELRKPGKCCGSGCRHCPFPPEEQQRAGRPPATPPSDDD